MSSLSTSTDYDAKQLDSLVNQKAKMTFRSKEWINIPDQTANSYSSNKIKFNGLELANNSKYVCWNEAFITFGVNAVLQSTAPLRSDGTVLDYPSSLTFKGAGSECLIESVLVKIGTKNVTNNTSFNNILNHYRKIIDYSREKGKFMTPTTIWALDDPSSIQVCIDDDDALVQVINNRVSPVLPTSPLTTNYNSMLSQYNDGLYQRALITSVQPYPTQGSNPLTGLVTQDDYTTIARNFCSLIPPSGNATSSVLQYNMVCILKLSELHDIFAQLNFPISNLSVYIELSLNVGNAVFEPKNGLTNQSHSVESSNFIGSSCPLMLTDVGFNALSPNSGGEKSEIIVKVNSPISTSNGNRLECVRTNCLLYIPSVVLNPSSEEEIRAQPQKVVKYWDFQSQEKTELKSGGSLQFIPTTGISNLKRVWLIPYYSASNFTNGITPSRNPKCAEPYLPSPQGYINNFNILLNGRTFFNEAHQYSYQTFLQNTMDEMFDGGENPFFSAGLYTQKDFDQAPFYCVNVERNPAILSADIPCSISFSGSNGSLLNMDYLCLMEYEQTITLDRSGAKTLVL